MNDASWKVYLIAIAALAFNLLFLTFVTALRRAKCKEFVNPEDARAFKGQPVPADQTAVAKSVAAHRNALENFVPFAVLALLYVMSGANPRATTIYCVTFVVVRWLHSGFYLLGMQPWRTLIFVLGFMVNIGWAVQVLMAGLR